MTNEKHDRLFVRSFRLAPMSSHLSLHVPPSPEPWDAALDPIAELKLRRWARERHVPLADRDPLWHAVVWQEMAQKDRERTTVPTPVAPSSAARPRRRAA